MPAGRSSASLVRATWADHLRVFVLAFIAQRYQNRSARRRQAWRKATTVDSYSN
jgi:hypothetical protein